MKYKTSLSAVLIDSPSKIIGVGSKQYFVDDEEFNDSARILDYLLIEREMVDIEQFLEKSMIDISIFNKLVEHNLITSSPELFYKEDTEDFKNGLYLDLIVNNPVETIEEFKARTFIVIGCGGIGNYMSYALSTYSPKEIIIIDGDRIERSNLNRQFLFSIDDIGKHKAEIISNELKARNERLNVNSINDYFSISTTECLKKLLKDRDCFGILSGDDDSVVREATQFFVDNNIPFVNIGYLNDLSVIGPFVIPKQTSCPFCYNSLSASADEIMNNSISKKLNLQYSSPSNFINSAVASSLALSDIIHFMSGNLERIKSINSRIGINCDTFESLKISNELDINCLVCGNNGDI